MVCDWSLHKGNANGNIHCHILTATRKIENNKFTSKVRDWDKKDFLNKLKKEWCYSVNPILEKRTDKMIHHKIGIDEKPKAPNLKVKEYHLIKRLVRDSLKNKKYKFEIDENCNLSVDYNLGFKAKRTEKKARKYFVYFAEKYNKPDLNNLLDDYKLAKKAAEKRKQEIEEQERIKQEQDFFNEVKKIARANFKNNTFLLEKVPEGLKLNFKHSQKDAKTDREIANKMLLAMEEVAKEKTAFKLKNKQIRKEIDKQQQTQRIRY